MDHLGSGRSGDREVVPGPPPRAWGMSEGRVQFLQPLLWHSVAPRHTFPCLMRQIQPSLPGCSVFPGYWLPAIRSCNVDISAHPLTLRPFESDISAPPGCCVCLTSSLVPNPYSSTNLFSPAHPFLSLPALLVMNTSFLHLSLFSLTCFPSKPTH